MNEEKLRRRVLLVSAGNGASVTLLGGAGLLLALLMKDIPGILVAIAVAASGVMELTGRSKAKARSADAGKWLAGSQLFLFATIVCYCAYQVWSFDPAQLGLVSGLRDALGENLGMDTDTLDEKLRVFCNGFYLSVVAVAFFYQGGMWWFYRRALAKLNAASVAALR
jgi:hypothetical protein